MPEATETANATLGVISSASLAVNTIGQGLALARGGMTKHAVKQVDRLLSNPGIEVDGLCEHWVPYVIGARDRIAVAMDWTDFDADNQATEREAVSHQANQCVAPPHAGRHGGTTGSI